MENQEWLYEIKPKGKLIDLNFKEIWRYRDLLVLFIKRDITTAYKQTILGPLWFLIQPLFTSVVFTLVFNEVAGIDNGAIPNFLFNLTGLTLWSYFKEVLSVSSSAFTSNAGLFGKVYFPRFIAPASRVLSGLFKFGIQLIILVIFYVYYYVNGMDILPSTALPLILLVLLNVILMGMGSGLILSAMTTKYRDLNVLIGFGLSLLLYLSAVMYSLEEAKNKLQEYYWAVEWNPIAHVIESYRSLWFGSLPIHWTGIYVGFFVGTVLFLIGLIVFNKTEKTFIDTV
ncbi:lipopolysaccharide transport system permease protein [Nonlabens sp. Hel1_33_55]|uniref:ABC transporter permease n=1 Tax=Nonlabens sp. Hel1_33_55 TaxID=1336802 RepID=UPI000875D16E|nr:ABC transporter permease [Nonlabens sp. Hel1_33_55]SCX91985.1 lipopolysaccharide transport system permease protein [Nonlabens sp. Hel1_33_55]